MLLCDFNVDLLQFDKPNAINNFTDQLHSLALYPLITRPTTITGHSKTLIDNISTTNLSNIQSGLIINNISDHLTIFQITEYIHNKRSNVTYNKRRIVNEQNINVMVNELKETNWYKILNSEVVNMMYNTFTEKLYKTCPIVKQKIVNKRSDKPWTTKSLKQACKKSTA